MTAGENQNRLLRHVEAVIFDMDGLMLDTERLDLQHFKRAAMEFGYAEVEDAYLQTIGRNGFDTRKLFHEILGDAFPFDAIRQRWRRYSEDHVARFGVPCKPGLQELLAVMQPLRLPKAVATSTRRRTALMLLDKANLLQHFDVVVAGDEVANGKPNPEIFLRTAERLNIRPDGCVVFEDSPAGIQAAHAAGMTPILVPDLIAPSPDILEITYCVFGSLEEALGLFGWQK
jgi:beta-phosphoglucomutase-like phosphatase (HAD superfamily)